MLYIFSVISASSDTTVKVWNAHKGFCMSTLRTHKVRQNTQIFFVFSGGKVWSHSEWNLGDFFTNFEKNPNLPKKKMFILED